MPLGGYRGAEVCVVLLKGVMLVPGGADVPCYLWTL